MMMRTQPKVQDNNPNLYKNPKGTIFLTIGTGGHYYATLFVKRFFC